MRKQLISLILTTTVLAGGVGVAHADDAPSAPTATEVTAAIADTVPGIATDTTDATVSHDADSAAITTTAGSTVDIPQDPADAIVFDAPSASPLEITIVGQGAAGDARATDDGTVVYTGTDEQASTVVQPTSDGGVRFLTVIDGPDAPTEYRFDMNLGENQRIVPMESGGFEIHDQDDNFLYSIDAPWAKDANAAAVPVSYGLEGTTIVMHVDHTAAAYPVVADPWWNPFSWDWGKIAKKCGKGAAAAVLGTGGSTVITNVGLARAGRQLVQVAGGGWGYVGLAGGGCVVGLFF